MPEKLLDLKQVKERLSLSERTIFRLLKTGELKGFKIGREWRFEEADIQNFIQVQRQKTEKMIQANNDDNADWERLRSGSSYPDQATLRSLTPMPR